MKLKETCFDDVKNMMIMWSTEKILKAWAKKQEYAEIEQGLWQEADTCSAIAECKRKMDAEAQAHVFGVGR